MTSKELCYAINASLFVPISEDLASQLLDVAKKLVTNMDMNDVDNCSLAFFKHEISPSYKGKFKTQYKSTYGGDLNVPDVVFSILGTCQVLLFLQTESVNNDLKAKAALIVRNNAILRKGDWYGTLCPIWIESMYTYYPKYGNKVFTDINDYDSLLKAVVPHRTWSNTGLDINDSKTYNSLRHLCASVVRGRVSSFANTAAFKNLSNPFSRVYLLVSKMIKDWQWKYIDASPVKTIMAVLGNDSKKRKVLGKIVDDVKKELSASMIVIPKEKSSVLLSRIADDRNSEIDGRQFSVLEFGVYLFYELLLETYND